MKQPDILFYLMHANVCGNICEFCNLEDDCENENVIIVLLSLAVTV